MVESEERPLSIENAQEQQEPHVVVRRQEHEEEANGQEFSNLSNGETGQTKDMGPSGKHVTTPNKEVKEHVSAASSADVVSCTTID